MAQNAISIVEALENIEEGKYLMPAIQREFVWKKEQIQRLFDSVWHRYPLGSLLLWTVKPPSVGNYKFFGFVTDYSEYDEPFGKATEPDQSQEVITVLDGQQRLTALNIGLRGTYTDRKKYARRDDPASYTKKWLCLDMSYDRNDEDNDSDNDKRLFVFKSAEELEVSEGKPNFFYKIEGLHLWEEPNYQLSTELEKSHNLNEKQSLIGASHVNQLVGRLQNESTLLSADMKHDDPDEILAAFVRLNSAGTTLSKADLLLAMAATQWKEKDAREEVRRLVQDINNTGAGFSFDKPMVLKAGLAIAGQSIGFNMKQFTEQAVTEIESKWDDIREALEIAAGLLDAFGFDERNLPVHDAVMIPLALWVYHNQITSKVVSHRNHKQQRDSARDYVLQATLIQDYWGRGVDQNLSDIRDAIVAEKGKGKPFPFDEVLAKLAESGNPMTIEDEAINEILDLEYNKRYTFSALARLVGGGLDFKSIVAQVDHIFPQAILKESELRDLGLADDIIQKIQERTNTLPNLQLLTELRNNEKDSLMPSEWLKQMDSDADRERYTRLHLLGEIPETIDGFIEWHDARRERLKERLVKLLRTE